MRKGKDLDCAASLLDGEHGGSKVSERIVGDKLLHLLRLDGIGESGGGREER